jgi:hypothetical protein
MKGRLFLYVVVSQSTPVLKLLASKTESVADREELLPCPGSWP